MAYNPADHIPLSKPLGAGRFPIDGKFKFYTNGAGGVYEYRPFQSIAEVLGYFPLGSDFRKGNFEILVNTGGILSGDGGSIAGGSNDVYWWKDGVADSDLVLKNTGAVSTPSAFGKTFPIDQSAIVDYTIDLSADTNIPMGVYPICSAWVDDVPYGQCIFNKTTRILSGLPETTAGQVVVITAIWSNGFTTPS